MTHPPLSQLPPSHPQHQAVISALPSSRLILGISHKIHREALEYVCTHMCMYVNRHMYVKMQDTFIRWQGILVSIMKSSAAMAGGHGLLPGCPNPLMLSPFLCILSQHLNIPLRRVFLLCPFYGWGNWGSVPAHIQDSEAAGQPSPPLDLRGGTSLECLVILRSICQNTRNNIVSLITLGKNWDKRTTILRLSAFQNLYF